MSESIVKELDRKVFCLLGIPIDVVSMDELVNSILEAKDPRAELISTPNLNFLVSSQTDIQFREVLRMSDLCAVDGVTLIWLARLLNIPIHERVAGSDMFEALISRTTDAPLRVFLFGGDPGVAEAAAARINANAHGVRCVGWLDPGRGTVEEMSRPEYIDAINQSGADFLVVALGAVKGQKWLQYNHEKLVTPFRSHLGAVINFQAGTIRRAPPAFRNGGLESLWRIKEEPYLWRRYAKDGFVLLSLIVTRVLPIRLLDLFRSKGKDGIRLTQYSNEDGDCTLVLSGDSRVGGLDALIDTLRTTLPKTRNLVLDLARLRFIDPRLIGVLFAIRKALRKQGGALKIKGANLVVRVGLRLHGAFDLVD